MRDEQGQVEERVPGEAHDAGAAVGGVDADHVQPGARERVAMALVEPEAAVVGLGRLRRAEQRLGVGVDDRHVQRLPDQRAQQLVDEQVAAVAVLAMRGALGAQHVARDLEHAVLEARAGAEERPAVGAREGDALQRALEARVRAARRAPHGIGAVEPLGGAAGQRVGRQPLELERDPEPGGGVCERGLDRVLLDVLLAAVSDDRDAHPGHGGEATGPARPQRGRGPHSRGRAPHHPEDHEEVYYIINGTGKIKMGNEETRFRDGDIIYIPENITHSIINDGEEMIDFLAFGGFTGKEKQRKE